MGCRQRFPFLSDGPRRDVRICSASASIWLPTKWLAAYGRREPRDVVDLLTIHDRILPLGAVVWASVGKTLGGTPEGIINEIRRTARYTGADFRRVASDPPVDPAATMTRLREILSEEEAFVVRMPTDKVAAVPGKAVMVQPDPARLRNMKTHAGHWRGQWPTSVEISAAMVERYGRPESWWPGGSGRERQAEMSCVSTVICETRRGRLNSISFR